MRVIRRGITRTVILVGCYAIKVPSLRTGSIGGPRGRLQSFAWGVLANHSEYEWSTYKPWQGRVAPVLRSWLFGLVQVYPRCAVLDEGSRVELPVLDPDPGDVKHDNYGWLGGRLVRLDYDMR